MPAHVPQADEHLDSEQIVQLLVPKPRSTEELRLELAKLSVFTDAETIERTLQWRADAHPFDDGTWGFIPHFADDLVLTHLLTDEEVELEVVDTADFELWSQLADEGFPFVSGGEVRSRYASPNITLPLGTNFALTGPPGWLAGHPAGTFIGIRLKDGVLRVEPVEELTEEAINSAEFKAVADLLLRTAMAAAADALDDYLDEDDPIPGASLGDVVAAVRREMPAAFRTLILPLTLLLELMGLEVWRGFVGVPGAPWHGDTPGVDEANAAALREWAVLLTMHRVSELLPTFEEASYVAAELTQEPALEQAGARIADDPDREPVAAAMADLLEGAARAMPLLMRARAAEGRGDLLAAERWLQETIAADPTMTLAVFDLADLQAIRGNAQEAWHLYQRGGMHAEAPAMAALRPFLRAPTGEVSRNQPCPCGSGRKYKMCHGRELRHPLPMRATWLWRKVTNFAERYQHIDDLMYYADVLAGEAALEIGGDVHEQTADSLIGDPLVHDLAMFDGELLRVFIEDTAGLLPDDERELAQSWLATERRLLEVVSVKREVSVVCRDLMSDETIEVTDRVMSTALEPNDLFFGRPVPDGGGKLRVIEGGRIVTPSMRGSLLELLRDSGEGADIAHFFAPRGRPDLRTTDGEDLVICEARYDVADVRGDVWEKLQPGMTDDGAGTLVEIVDAQGDARVPGEIRQEDDQLVITAYSVERLRRLQARVLDADPSAQLVAETTVPLKGLIGGADEDEDEFEDVDEH